MVRAFVTSYQGINSIVFADSPGKARSITHNSARDAGYKPDFTDISVSRAQSFDRMQMQDGQLAQANRCYIAEYLMECQPKCDGCPKVATCLDAGPPLPRKQVQR